MKLPTSEKIDQDSDKPPLAISALIMVAVYYIAVNSVGTIVTEFLHKRGALWQWIMPGVASLLKSAGAADWVISLVVDCIMGGISAPNDLLLKWLSFLSSSFVPLKIENIWPVCFLHHGQDIPPLRGFPARASYRFLYRCRWVFPELWRQERLNEKDRRLTMMTTTMIPCGAKLPVIALIAGRYNVAVRDGSPDVL